MEEEFEQEQEQKSQNGGGMVEVAPFYESRVRNFVSMYESCSIEEAEEFFDDVKLRVREQGVHDGRTAFI